MVQRAIMTFKHFANGRVIVMVEKHQATAK